GDARAHIQPMNLPGLVAGDLFGDRRAWSHEAHLAAQHVEELRDLIHAGDPRQMADARDPRISRDLEHGSAAPVQVRDWIARALRAVHHRAELEEGEGSCAATEACRAVNDRAR